MRKFLLILISIPAFAQTIQFKQLQKAPGAGFIPYTMSNGEMSYSLLSSFIPSTTPTPSITINGITKPLNPTPTFTVGDLYSTGSYSNPSWLTSLDYSKITNTPTVSAWGLSGNAITTNTNFIGTTTNRSLLLGTNNSIRFKVDSSGIFRMFTTASTSTVNGSFFYDGGLSGNNGFNFYSNDPSDLSFIFKYGNSHNSLSYYGDHTTNNWLVVPNGQNFTVSNDGGNSVAYQIGDNQQHAWINKNLTTPVSGVHIYNWTGAAYTNQTASSEISPYGMAMGTIQYNAGTLARQRGLVVDQPSISFASASTLTEGGALSVAGPVMVGANGTCPISSGVSIGRLLAVPLNTNVVIGTGLYCNAPTGAQNNYSALFAGGNVGIGTTAPTFNLDVTGTGRFSTNLTAPLIYGSGNSAGTLTLSSTSNATKGKIIFGTSAYDEVNNRLGIANTSPAFGIDVTGMIQATTGFISNGTNQLAQINGYTNNIGIYGKLSNGTVFLGYNAGSITAGFDSNGMTMTDGLSIITGTTTGLKIGTATTQKLGFFNATPVVQQTATTDLGTALSNLGLRASGTAYPITTSGAAAFNSTTNTTLTNNNLAIATLGKTLVIKEGTNGMSGTATLVGGTVTVSNTAITATSRIFLTGIGTTSAGYLTVTKAVGTGFTITSSSPSDARAIDYFIITGN